MNRQVTIKDIATALNLSASTVSRALHGLGTIGISTRKKIIAYAEQMNYRPNVIAQSLRSQQSRSIGVVLCNIDNNFFSEVVDGIESAASEKGYLCLFTQSRESYALELNHVEALAARNIDGLLVSVSAGTKKYEHFLRLQQSGLPIVFFDRVMEDWPAHQVVADNFAGAYQLTNHLINEGYKCIAHISSAPHLSITKERLAGYKRALWEHAIPYSPEYVKFTKNGGASAEENATAFRRLLAMDPKPDAIITGSDRLTLHTFSNAINNGYKVPQDIAIGGFANLKVSNLIPPSLTCVHQPAYEMGKAAAEMLIQLIGQKRTVKEMVYERKVLTTTLHVGQSTMRV